jgi:menaquinone-dependent protoporphyrinogen IX oxidase
LSGERKPTALIVYHTYTKQSGRVADAIATQLQARGCEVTRAMIELTDPRWVPKLFSQFPLKRPVAQISTMLTAQLRHKTGEIRVPAEAQAGDYDLVVIASPTWWIQLSMPIRSYLESPAAKAILEGKPFATVSVSRRYYGYNLRQQRRLAEQNGGRFVGETHFVAAGGQVKSMLSWLGYMKHGEPQDRSMGMTLPPPNLRSDFEQQAKHFADRLADSVLQPPATTAESQLPG